MPPLAPKAASRVAGDGGGGGWSLRNYPEEGHAGYVGDERGNSWGAAPQQHRSLSTSPQMYPASAPAVARSNPVDRPDSPSYRNRYGSDEAYGDGGSL
ncbi:hypothetical protein HK097_004699 [Rhizophlyctis rosea]|uniref:Uncharacterized protein n=1 Tax=Rhizophlyctis rosea TaxID=64517 RepID=A0AAD5WWL6_9FUNG|nr:hypothetical protein HK097_004699 [Rhizophlyctis rosea]